MTKTNIENNETDKAYQILLDLYNLLGENAVLLPAALKTKRPIFSSWEKTKYEDTLKEPYWSSLLDCAERGGNLGVNLTNGLTTIDCDSDEYALDMIRLNPVLEDTLISIGRRGCQFWLQQTGDYLKAVKPLKTKDGEKFGEWRGGGQSIIFGEHEKSTIESPIFYQTNGKKVITSLQFNDIVWSDCVKHCWVEVPKSYQKSSTKDTSDINPDSTGTPISESLSKRITAYMLKVPASIEGQSGDDQLFKAACKLVQGFNLSPEQALPFLEVYDQRSEPPWSDSTEDYQKLVRKLDEADKSEDPQGRPRGYLLNSDREEVRAKFTKVLEGAVDMDALEADTLGLKPADLEMVIEVLMATKLDSIKLYQVCGYLCKPLFGKQNQHSP